jgi:hypothetical protein
MIGGPTSEDNGVRSGDCRTFPFAETIVLKQAYWDGALEHHPCNFRLSDKGFPSGLSISSERHSVFYRFGFCLVP